MTGKLLLASAKLNDRRDTWVVTLYDTWAGAYTTDTLPNTPANTNRLKLLGTRLQPYRKEIFQTRR